MVVHFISFLHQHATFAVLCFLALAYSLRVAYCVRQGLLWMCQAFLVGVIAASGAALAAELSGLPGIAASGIAGVCGWIAFGLVPKRSRHIPKSVRRQVIQKHIRKKGSYNPQKHHLDHRVPFSKGGSHTADNLRVISKRRNLKKGARMPSFREAFF